MQRDRFGSRVLEWVGVPNGWDSGTHNRSAMLSRPPGVLSRRWACVRGIGRFSRCLSVRPEDRFHGVRRLPLNCSPAMPSACRNTRPAAGARAVRIRSDPEPCTRGSTGLSVSAAYRPDGNAVHSKDGSNNDERPLGPSGATPVSCAQAICKVPKQSHENPNNHHNQGHIAVQC